MSKRWLANWKDSDEKPAIYHCVSRVVDRRYVMEEKEREKFRTFMRMQENFTGCRVLSYCVMSNHFHILLEVPPIPLRVDGSGMRGLSDEELLKRLSVLYGAGDVAEIAKELAESRKDGDLEWVEKIHARYTYRMYDLSEFMKTLLIRFTRWYNQLNKRTGTLWEDRFKSVIVESGTAARMIAAYIDLNPVRAGMVVDPAEYRWSSYGEAIGGGAKGNGKKAREGLVRAIEDRESRCQNPDARGEDLEAGDENSEDKGRDFNRVWKEASQTYRVLMGMALERKPSSAKVVVRSAQVERGYEKMGRGRATEDRPHGHLPELGMAKMLRTRVRYFTDGAVIGSKDFVNEAFASARERFTEKRKDGARKMRGSGKAAAGTLWSVRDLRVKV